jgi:hypothetical protein
MAGNNGTGTDASASEHLEVHEPLTCFIVSPIGEEGTDVRRRSNQVMNHVINPAVEAAGYTSTRADLTNESGQITTQIITQLLKADLVVADLTDHNPNVFYELAVRHAFGKPFIQIIDKKGRLPFDVAGQWTVFFDYRDLDSVHEAKKQIEAAARTIAEGDDDYKTDSPVSQTIDLQQLKSSGNPEQVAIAELTEMVANLHRDVRLSRNRQSSGTYTPEQTKAIREVLFNIADDGRMTRDDIRRLMESAPRTRSFDMLVYRLLEHAGFEVPRGPRDDLREVVVVNDNGVKRRVTFASSSTESEKEAVLRDLLQSGDTDS